jgi:hypothetical protein
MEAHDPDSVKTAQCVQVRTTTMSWHVDQMVLGLDWACQVGLVLLVCFVDQKEVYHWQLEH